MGFDLLGGRIRDTKAPTSRHTSRVEEKIVMNHYDAVGRAVDIKLDRLGTELDGPSEGRNRVFGQGVVCPPVGDADRSAARVLGQGFLGGE